MMDTARLVRRATRAGERAYRSGRRFREGASVWSEEQRSQWVLQQLRRTVQEAARTPFYADRFRRQGFDAQAPFTFEEFARLPILEREDITQHAEAMRLPVPEASVRKDATGGSTGMPLTYWSGPEERGWRSSGQDAFLAEIGVNRWSRTAYLWGHHIDRAERAAWRDRIRDVVTDRHWYDCFRMSPEVVLEYHGELSRVRPWCLLAYASALDSMATTLIEHGLRAAYPVHRIVTGAEKLWPAQRARIEQAFSCPVHEQYGSRELGLVAAQLDPRRTHSLQVDWPNVLIEPEHTGPSAAVIVTKLHADAMPMLRYRVGDEAKFPVGAEPGHPTWELDEVLGRMVDRLFLPDGRWLNGLGIPHMMKDREVREFQVRQNADYTVDILVIPTLQFGQANADDIVRILGENLPGLELRLQRVTEIPRGAANKWRPVISHVVARPGAAAGVGAA